jgi:hypothetical protein
MNADEFPESEQPAPEWGMEEQPEPSLEDENVGGEHPSEQNFGDHEQISDEQAHTDQISSEQTPASSETASAEPVLATLTEEIAQLQQTKANLEQQIRETQTAFGNLIQESLSELQQRKQVLQTSVEQLERRQERIEAEMRKSFAGVSQDLAIRVQGFKDYLVNSLQDLAVATEQLDLVPKASLPTSEPATSPLAAEAPTQKSAQKNAKPQFSEREFEEESQQIRDLLDQYRNNPDYYGPPWQLRRTFEPVHAERVSNWFFTLGGRGALRSLNSRLQNILIASAVVSILYELYGDQLRPLVLANSPERLGDWRRGLQDCLGITRADFGTDRGVGLFESPEALAQKADRLLREDQLPLILIDDSEEQVSLSMLQFPLLLAFAPEPQLRQPKSTFDFFE